MDEAIARANIKHFKALLVDETTDNEKRKMLLELLAEEERKLATALSKKRTKD